MTHHNSARDALEAIFTTIRRQVDRDPSFGAELLSALRVKDPDKKKVIKAYNLASAEELTGRDAPKGQALVELMWNAACAKRKRLEERK